MISALHFWVSGRVQGVSFRAKTQEMARELRLTGWVRNLEDGRVEGLACGKHEALGRFQEWLAQGPELASVENVEYRAEPLQDFERFEIRY